MENKDLHSKVEQTLNSLDHVERAFANPFLFTRVMEKMPDRSAGRPQPALGKLKPIAIWQLAASMVIVLGLNITIGLYVFNKKTTISQTIESGYFTNHIYNY